MTASSPQQPRELQRQLTNRHIQLIAIGGAIGTGLFMGSGKTISLAGPSILLVYAIIGAALFLFMRCMGELLLANPHVHSFSDIAEKYLGHWARFAMSWTYWLCWIVTGVADLVAITGYFRFWWPGMPSWIPILGTIALLFLLNALTVKAFGETEFWFALIKIVAIVALIVVGTVLICLGATNSSGSTAAVSNLWEHGGLFPHGFSGFVTGFQIALFAFVGVELVGATVAETKDPQTALPKAVNSIPLRIGLFYIGSLAVIMMVTPWNEIVPENSPFVTMFALTGLPAAATIVNLVVITSAASSANSGIYSTSRMVYGLAHSGDAHRVFAKLSPRQVPRNALTLSCVFLLSALVLMATGDGVLEAFTMVTSMSATLFLAVWTAITCSYLVYCRREPDARDRSAFPTPGGRAAAIGLLAFFALMCVALSLAADTRGGLIAALLWVVAICAVGLRRHKSTA
ncbi:amino acid permease [Corynebacterium sp. zg-331]|uniref:amino acid permease n=1 Tax=unclassified Corynebacterium TaxID=2624378 RepID=UPI00128C5EA6|nr:MULTISPECIES: amino acid permease [unclassified Corynebacterium]MBC3185985.1 amino acid permease [Corynebacterium sp. zg-331]MPV52476.1 amino acid permease [Corynebacterium sp. zg331]